MKTKLYFYSQPNYLTRTAIVREQKQFIKIAFAVHLSAVISAERYRSDSGALKSAVLHFVFFMIIINKMQQSACQSCLKNSLLEVFTLMIGSGKTMAFENRWSRYKEPSKNKAEAYRVYVEHLFLRSDAGDARIFSKEEDVYGIDYGFGLDAPKETEQANPQDLFAYRRNYTWNERNLLTKSSDRNFTVHYRYGEDGQRALKYTDEGRSETLYFNNFFTIHIPTQDQNNPQGLRVHKHIFVGNSRLVTAMTHTDNQGDNEEQKAKQYYYHSDHLGSAQFITDWRGRQYEHIEYTPYGELWIEEVAAGLDKLPFRFTGKELDEETGLYYYGARYLDPKYSRWLSGDPALGEYMAGSSVGEGGIYNAVNFNVYHYGGNNPIKYVDPTGMWSDNGDGTYTAEKGDTLFELYGDDWKEKSGYEGDPTKMPIGTIVGNKFEEPEDRDRNNSMTNILSPEQIEAFAPDNASSSASNENKYSQTKNIVLGIGEMIGGLIMVGGTVYVAAMSPPTAVNPGAQGLLLPGFGFFAHGLGRVVGANNNTIGEDIKSSFMPPEAATMEELVKDQRRKKR